MRIAIIGCGSLGLLWAGRISTTVYKPTVFTRTQEQKEKIVEQGITLISYENKKVTYRVPCEKISYCLSRTFDVVLVMVKQSHLIDLIPTIQSMTCSESQILFAQNGLGHEEKIGCLYDRPWTYALITTEGACRQSSVTVSHTGQGDCWVGRYPGRDTVSHPLLKRWIVSMQLAGFKINWDNGIQQRMWDKFLVNCIINPLTVIYGVCNGELQRSRYTKEIDKIIAEMVQVCYRWNYFLDEVELKKRVRKICCKTAMNFSSMLQDVQRGTPTEIDYLTGRLIWLAEQAGVDVPYNRYLFNEVKKLEVKCQRPATYTNAKRWGLVTTR